MATRRQHVASELQVLQEAVASAVHELSQPLNVVNLLADNALEDVSVLQAAGVGDAAVLADLRRRIEQIVEQSEKASDITRWIRAFAVGIGGDVTEFDPDAVIQRIAGIFTNDLRVAGVALQAAPAPGRRSAVGDESLLGFALTETILWMRATLAPHPPDEFEETLSRRIAVACSEDAATRKIVVEIRSGIGDTPAGAASSAGGEKIPTALPMLALAARAPGNAVAIAPTANGGVQVCLSLPMGDWQPAA